MSVAGVPEHAHCEICHTPVTVGERFCDSKACAEKHLQNVKEKKRQVYILVAMLAGVLVLAKLL